LNIQEQITGKNGKQLLAFFRDKDKDEYLFLLNYTNFLPVDASLSERVYCYINNIENIQYCTCGKIKKFHKMNIGYFKTCGDSLCIKSNRINSINNTMLNKYGSHTSSLESTKTKRKQTLLENYGDENYVNIKARTNTMQELYGVNHALQLNEFIKKKKDTQLLKYGDENYNNQDKIKLTNLDRYGTKNIASCEFIKQKTKNTFMHNHLEKLNERISDLQLKVNSSKDNRYYYTCLDCLTDYDMSNSAFNVHIRSNESPCNICNPPKQDFKSIGENQLYDYICSIYDGAVIQNYMRGGSNELDVYLPDENLAFEYNGLYYHCELFKDKNYHLNKKQYYLEKNINVIHIFEDEWLYNRAIVESRIANILGYSKKIYARKCTIKHVPLSEARDFLNANHLQGYVNSRFKIGLYYNNELVSVMTFGKPRFDKAPDTLELLRFSSKLGHTIIGGANKLFKYFISNNNVNRIVTESNRCWQLNNTSVYANIGMLFIKYTVPGYWYKIRNVRTHRFNYRLSRLKKMNMLLDSETARDCMLRHKIYRIYDCGNSVYVWNR
jgi:rubrerythrin